MDFIKLFSGGFPLTIERLIFVQETYKKAFQQFSTVLGDGTHYIVSGVETAGALVTDGVVSINGEILPFIGGTLGANVTIRSTSITVPYNEDADSDGNLDPKAADTVRICYAELPDTQADDEVHPYASFVRTPQLSYLLPTIGDVKLIARAFDPVVDKGWELIDMADAFPIAAGGAHSVNAAGGANEVSILKANLPNYTMSGSTNSAGAHTHTYSKARDGRGYKTKSDDNPFSNNDSVQTSSAGAHTHSISISTGGSNTPLNIKPKYKAFNFLIFVGI